MPNLKPYRTFTDRWWPRNHKVRPTDYRLLTRIRKRASKLETFSDDTLLEKATELRQKLVAGQSTLAHASIVESFALTTEALRRTTGKVYYDVQLIGGLVLATGSIAEMQTGEGKTITCALPAVLYGLTGSGVHVATTNAYLAERDHEELIPIFNCLGITSGFIQSDQKPAEKREAYNCDVTYGTGYEFGFDFLRDQLRIRNQPKKQLGTRFLGRLRGIDSNEVQLTQRSLAFAIIDEADSVLIDEATTPLILSGAGGSVIPNRDVYHHAMVVADSLEIDIDFETNAQKKSIDLTDAGWSKIHQHLTPEVQANLQRPWSTYIEQSLRARLMMHREVDYVVNNEEVVIVDQNTGRIHEERKWRSGLHQSVEIRENVPLTEEREIEARITRQRYFQFYQQVSGMTGTATGNEAELLEFYDLPVIPIPRNKKSKRIKEPSRYFANERAKFEAIAASVVERQKTGQPTLVGTRTITQSQELSKLLTTANVNHTVLNGIQDEGEASIIANAGELGHVTIATNMAGRGTDIKIDKQAIEAGGLHVIGVEHHETPRVDRQLLGRAARQSDPGSFQFFVSAEDDIIARFNPGLAKSMVRSANELGECAANFDNEIVSLQDKIEKTNYTLRQRMVTHDRWTESVQKSVAKLA